MCIWTVHLIACITVHVPVRKYRHVGMMLPGQRSTTAGRGAVAGGRSAGGSSPAMVLHTRYAVSGTDVAAVRYYLAVVTDRNEVYMWGTTGYPALSGSLMCYAVAMRCLVLTYGMLLRPGSLPVLVTPPSTAPPISIACTSDHLVRSATGLRARYAMSGTDLAYAATSW
eukprot:1657587-Rhodomonas_salina.2